MYLLVMIDAQLAAAARTKASEWACCNDPYRLDMGNALKMPEAVIISDPKIMMGKPVVRGTRITVELILEKLAAGESVDQILTAHPRLTVEGIRAAMAFAAESLRADVVYPFEKVS